jgi:hypothetical protein
MKALRSSSRCPNPQLHPLPTDLRQPNVAAAAAFEEMPHANTAHHCTDLARPHTP